MRRRIIKISIVLLGIVSGIWCCNYSLNRNKDRHLQTERLGKGIFKEKFETFNGGVLMTSDYSYYITDSTIFRKFIGTLDEKEFYKCESIGDSIKAVIYSRRVHYGSSVPIDSVIYSIKDLKQEGKFE